MSATAQPAPSFLAADPRHLADTELQPPFFMNKEVMAETAQLEQFDEELYKVCIVPFN